MSKVRFGPLDNLQQARSRLPGLPFRIQRGWDRTRLCWVAERVRGLDVGVHTVITTDVHELRAALDAYDSN